MVAHKVLLVEENKYYIEFFQELFEKWNMEFSAVPDVSNSLIKINILKPDFIIISTDLPNINYDNLFSFMSPRNFKLFFYGNKKLDAKWNQLANFKGFFSLPNDIIKFKNTFYSLIINNYKPITVDSHIEVLNNEKVGVVEIAGNLLWEQIHELKYRIIEAVKKENILGFVFIFHELENSDSELADLICHLFSFVHSIHFDMQYVKYLTLDKRIFNIISQPDNGYQQIEMVSSYAEAFMKVQGAGLNKSSLGLYIDFIKENTKLIENVYTETGELIKKAGEYFTKDDLYELRRKGIEKIYYAHELSHMGIAISSVSEVKKNIEEIIIKQASLAFDIADEKETGQKIDLSNKLVIIVEDEKSSQALLSKLFDKLKCNYKIADNGKDALTYAIQFNPNLIILDLMMPGMNGVEFIKQYREVRKNLAAPIIITSGVNKPEVIQHLIKTGMVKEYFLKPIVDLKGFVTKILKYMS